MSELQAGDFVVCLHTITDSNVHVDAGQIYCVAEVMKGRSTKHPCVSGYNCEEPGITLTKPVTRPGTWWCSTNFTLIFRPKENDLESFKIPPPDIETIRREIAEEQARDVEQAKNGPTKKKKDDGPASFYWGGTPGYDPGITGWDNDEAYWFALWLSLYGNMGDYDTGEDEEDPPPDYGGWSI